MALKTIDASFR